MSLRALADAIVRSRCSGQCTPVLVVSPSLAMKRSFVLALCSELIAVDRESAFKNISSPETRALQIDWVRGGNDLWSVLSDPIARTWANGVAARASAACGAGVQIQITTTISRPSHKKHELVLGLCDSHVHLSPWTSPIHLGASPMPATALQ